MGMYTEFHFNAEMKPNLPKDVVNILLYMLNKAEKPAELPDHEFFRCDRWRQLFVQDSHSFAADTYSTLRFDYVERCYFLCVRSNLKNYDGEIESFVDWVMPYINELGDKFLGFSRYEEDDEPALIYLKPIHQSRLNHCNGCKPLVRQRIEWTKDGSKNFIAWCDHCGLFGPWSPSVSEARENFYVKFKQAKEKDETSGPVDNPPTF